MVNYCQNEGVNTFFVVEIDMAKVNSYEIDMLYNNFVDGIIQPEFRSIDGEMLLYSNINGMKSIRDYVAEGNLSAKQAAVIMQSMCNVVIEAEEYMLNPDNLMIGADSVFGCMAMGECRFVYVPGYDENVKMQIRRMVENIIKNIDHRDSRLVDYMYNIYETVVADNYDINTLKKYVDGMKEDCREDPWRYDRSNVSCGYDSGDESDVEESGEVCQKMEKTEITQENIQTTKRNIHSEKMKNGLLLMLIMLTIAIGSGILVFQLTVYGRVADVRMVMLTAAVTAVELFLYIEFQKKNEQGGIQVQPAGMSVPVPVENLQPEKVLCQPAGTQLLRNLEDVTTLLTEECKEEGNAEEDGMAVAFWNKQTGEHIEIHAKTGESLVGRDTDADIFINEKSVSRRHAVLCERHGKVYIKDLGSTNGTCVNGIRLARDKYWPIEDGDTLVIGGKEYSVQTVFKSCLSD